MIPDENRLVHPGPLAVDVLDLVEAENRRSEVIAARLRLLLGGIGCVAIAGNWGSNKTAAMVVATGAVAVALAFALWAWRRARAGRLTRRDRIVVSTVDMTFVTAFSASGLWNYSGPYEVLLAPLPPVLYTIFLVFPALGGNVYATAWAGFLAAAERLFLLEWIIRAGMVETSEEAVYGQPKIGLPDQYTVIGFLFVVGALLTFLAVLLRRDSIHSAEETISRQAAERVKANLRKYLSANVADLVASRPEAMALGGARRMATVMFVDIRDFTPLTVHARPEEVVAMLNTLFGELVEIVFRHGGTLDKFLGDGLMAVFGVPQELADAPQQALAAAIEMLAVTRVLQERGIRPDDEPLRIGIGVAHGVVVAGNIGSAQRLEFTCIGEAVNYAARLCGLCRDLNQDLVVSESVYDACRDLYSFREMPKIKVKGIAGEPTLWAVTGPRRPSGSSTS